ncbi:hypothetical protein [Marinifilum fragile]|uniref:hypothetical protein n=1 Tax=Marinifilum fragile TaxID=570161 RepID=UPI002AA8C964|nr:hypothetical protein [Marinifilum fragile]
MKLTTILILIMVFLNFNWKNKKDNEHLSNQESIKKTEIREELEWEELEEFINHFAKTKPDLNTGKATIINFIKTKIPSFDHNFIEGIDFLETQKEFLSWVKEPLLKSKPDDNIVGLYFGLFTSSDPQLSKNGKELTVLYIAGSEISPKEDPTDWAVDPTYFPLERYCVLSSFSIIDSELKKYTNTSDLEQVLFNGITNLILLNSMEELGKLSNNEEIYIGSGFDSGDCYNLGKTK